MNAKQVKKIRQLYKRDLRAKLGIESDFLGALLKQKPKYYPSWLWRLGARLYFNRDYNNKVARPRNSKKP